MLRITRGYWESNVRHWLFVFGNMRLFPLFPADDVSVDRYRPRDSLIYRARNVGSGKLKKFTQTHVYMY